MIRCREMINLFTNAQELDATYVIRYEGWEFGSCSVDDFSIEDSDNPKVIKEIGYHEVTGWEIITMDVSDRPNAPVNTVFLIVILIKRECPAEDPGPAQAPRRSELLKLFNFDKTIDDSDAVKVTLTTIDNANDYVQSIYLIRENDGHYIDPRNGNDHGVTLEIQITCCETGVILDWSGYNQLLNGQE